MSECAIPDALPVTEGTSGVLAEPLLRGSPSVLPCEIGGDPDRTQLLRLANLQVPEPQIPLIVDQAGGGETLEAFEFDMLRVRQRPGRHLASIHLGLALQRFLVPLREQLVRDGERQRKKRKLLGAGYGTTHGVEMSVSGLLSRIRSV